MTKKPWTPEREAALLARSEKGFDPHEVGPAVSNPLRKGGRPSLSPEGGKSKALNARIPSDLHGKVVAFADRTGRSVSDLTRDALSAFVSAEAEVQTAPAVGLTRMLLRDTEIARLSVDERLALEYVVRSTLAAKARERRSGDSALLFAIAAAEVYEALLRSRDDAAVEALVEKVGASRIGRMASARVADAIRPLSSNAG